MLKILFNRDSRAVLFLEVIGWIEAVLVVLFVVRTGAMFTLLSLCLFVRACHWIHWYPQKFRGLGIEVHFKKSIVPSAYILAIVSLICLLQIPVVMPVILILANLMLLALVSVNVILIYFHLKDKDPLPINYFSNNQYLHEKLQPPSH